MTMKPKYTKRSVWHYPLGVLLAVGLATTALHAQPTTLAEFQFNEGTGTLTRSPTNNLTGSLVDPANVPEIITDTPSGAANDRAVQLAGTGYLLVDDSDGPILAVATEPLTLETWIKWDGTDTDQYNGILAYGASYKLGLNNGVILWTLFGVVDVDSGHALPPDGLWHHVAAVYEPGVGVTVYLDGLPSFVAETRSMRAFGNNRFSIGSEGLGNAILAAFDRVRVHKALLSAEELDSVAVSPKAPLSTTLVAYNFNETTLPFQNAQLPARPTLTSEDLIAPVFSTDSPSGRAGDFSLNYPTATGRVTVADPDTAIRFENGDFTIQAWVKFGPLPARAVLYFNNGPGGAVSFSVFNREIFVTTLGVLDRDTNAAIPDDGGWHHLAVVHETGKEFRFYVDGILSDTIPYLGGVLIDVRTATTFFIGSEPGGGLPYVGKLDRLIVSKGMVPAAELDYRPIPGVDPDAPELTIQSVVEVAWPSLPAGYVLQSTTTIGVPASWTNVPGTPQATAGTYRFYFPVSSQQTYYRLFKP